MRRFEALDASTSRLDQLREAAGLAAVQHRNRWIAAGIFVQLVAVAIPLVTIYERARHESVAGSALRATVLVAARAWVHTTQGVLVLAASAALFALGSVLLARPFVRSLGTLLVAVPIAAVAGVLVLGALALVVAVVAALAGLGVDDIPGGTGGSRKKKTVVRTDG
jgi:hypothetical protein